MMTKFDFDTVHPRQQTDSDKWCRYAEHVLPMWIADMDFKTPECINQGMKALIDHGILAYGQGRPIAVLKAVQQYFLRKFNWTIDEDAIIFLPGLVSGLNIAARAIGEANESLLTTTPIYPPFLKVADNQGKKLQTVELLTNPQKSYLHYELDVERIAAASDASTRLLMLCQPHNPTGRIFSREELLPVATLAAQKDWVVLSDEIHAELVLEGKHVPYALLNDVTRQHTITLFAPSKTYNIAGLGASVAIIENPAIRKKFQAAMAGIVPSPNIFAMEAMRIAFTQAECDAWLNALLAYLKNNRDYAIQALQKVSGLKMTCPEATFLLWLDCRATALAPDPYTVLLNAGVALNEGSLFGQGGKGFVRLNFACPRPLLEEGISRILRAVSNF